jgi:hypothetical protein
MDLKNTRFSKWLVLEYSGRDKYYNRKWLCKCDCGTVRIVAEKSLRSEQSTSCGCSRVGIGNGNWKGYQDISSSYWTSLKSSALTRNFEFNISIEDAWILFERQEGLCAITGVPLNFGSKYTESQTASLDRIDSSIGYELSNVQWVHKLINRMKMDLTEHELLEWARKIVAYNDSSSGFSS